MAGLSDLLKGTAGPMDMRSLAGQMGMGAQMETAGGPVQNMGMPPPGGMDMMGPMGGPMQGGPPMPGPMGGEGMMNPMLAEMGGQPPEGVSPDTTSGLQTLLQFANMEDQEIIELILATKPQEEVVEILVAIGEQLGRPTLLEAAQALEGGGEPPEVMGMGEGMVG